MRVIVNATLLIALAILERLDLLRQMFDEVIVPSAVYEEVAVRGAKHLGAALILEADWLQIASPDAIATIEPLLLGLDAGEMEVLLLAREQRPDWVLIDERQARRGLSRSPSPTVISNRFDVLAGFKLYLPLALKHY